MNRIGRSPLLGDLEFGDFLLASIARRVWCDGGSCTLGLEMMIVGFGWVVTKGLDNGVRVDLAGSVNKRQTVN